MRRGHMRAGTRVCCAGGREGGRGPLRARGCEAALRAARPPSPVSPASDCPSVDRPLATLSRRESLALPVFGALAPVHQGLRRAAVERRPPRTPATRRRRAQSGSCSAAARGASRVRQSQLLRRWLSRVRRRLARAVVGRMRGCGRGHATTILPRRDEWSGRACARLQTAARVNARVTQQGWERRKPAPAEEGRGEPRFDGVRAVHTAVCECAR